MVLLTAFTQIDRERQQKVKQKYRKDVQLGVERNVHAVTVADKENRVGAYKELVTGREIGPLRRNSYFRTVEKAS